MQGILKRRFPQPTPLISEAMKAKSLGDITSRLSAGDGNEQKAAELINAIGANQLKRAQDMTTSEPFSALEQLEDINALWAGSEIASSAAATLQELEADSVFQNRLAAGKIVKNITDIEASMQDVKDAATNTYTDPYYLKRNSSKLKRMRKLRETGQRFPRYPGGGHHLHD